MYKLPLRPKKPEARGLLTLNLAYRPLTERLLFGLTTDLLDVRDWGALRTGLSPSNLPSHFWASCGLAAIGEWSG